MSSEGETSREDTLEVTPRDGKSGLAPKAFGLRCSLDFARNDVY
jgi:hypothetical protein